MLKPKETEWTRGMEELNKKATEEKWPLEKFESEMDKLWSRLYGSPEKRAEE